MKKTTAAILSVLTAGALMFSLAGCTFFAPTPDPDDNTEGDDPIVTPEPDDPTPGPDDPNGPTTSATIPGQIGRTSLRAAARRHTASIRRPKTTASRGALLIF